MTNNLDNALTDFRLAQYKEWGEGRPADLPGAARLYRRAALRGYADAQHALGFLCATGQGVPRDEAMAVAWFRRAAEQGHCSAQHNLGVMYAEGRGVEQDEAQAIFWFYKAALGGSDVARDWLATTRTLLREQLAADC